MTTWSTTVRATHLLTNAAWFGGSLMGAVALNPASREGDDARERAAILDEGWGRWGPVQGAAVALHLLSGVAIVADNRRRVLAHRPTTVAVVLKTALTGVADRRERGGVPVGRGPRATRRRPPTATRPRASEARAARRAPAVGPVGHPGRDGRAARPRRLPRRAAAWRRRAPRPAAEDREAMRREFGFEFERSYRVPALLFGIRPATARAAVTEDELLVRFGPWRLRTPLSNVAGTDVTGDYAWLRTAGPAHLGLRDRGVTFATTLPARACASRSSSRSSSSTRPARCATRPRRSPSPTPTPSPPPSTPPADSLSGPDHHDLSQSSAASRCSSSDTAVSHRSRRAVIDCSHQG